MKAPNGYVPGSRALHALEATVRLGKATLAARELNITQAAVSHRIRELEEHLGQPLFRRFGRKLEPTSAALVLADAIRASVGTLQAALDAIGQRPASSSLTASMPPALASKWLAPLLPDMLRAFPVTELRISASREVVDLRRERVDVAIRYGCGGWPNVRSRHLCDELLAPVIAPSLLAQVDPSRPDVFPSVPLLRCDDPDAWEHWFERSRIPMPWQAGSIVFDDHVAMIEAAIAGVGVALGRSALVAHDLRAGRLVAPFGCVMCSPFGYWLVQDAGTPETATQRDFSSWVEASLGHDARALGEAHEIVLAPGSGSGGSGSGDTGSGDSCSEIRSAGPRRERIARDQAAEPCMGSLARSDSE